MLKGKTTIQLYDAVTGELTDSVTKENIVTNAVKNALGGSFNKTAVCENHNLTMNGAGYTSLFRLPSSKNFAQALFGGVLIFSKNIDEDVNHIIPTIDEIKSCIGCANQSSSNVGNSYRGSLNTSESVIGDDYVTFVWDFTTEQANGDIACICLTSDCGGAAGWAFDAKDASINGRNFRNFRTNGIWDSSVIHSIDNYAHSPLIISAYSNSNGGKCVYIDGDYLYYVYRGIAYKQDIRKALNNFGIGLIDGFDYGKLSSYETIDTGISSTRDIKNYCKDHAYCQDGDGSYTSFNLVKYSGNGNAEKITIPTDNINSSISAYFNLTGKSNAVNVMDKFLYNDKIYLVVGQVNWADLTTRPNKMRIYVLNMNGTFTYKDINLSSSMINLLFGTTKRGGYTDSSLGCSFTVFQGSLCIRGYDSTNGYAYFLVDEDGSMSDRAFLCSSDITLYSLSIDKLKDWIPEPYMSCIISGDKLQNIYTTELVSAYLATINNQDIVLTKTADKTMKIIYTLTQV